VPDQSQNPSPSRRLADLVRLVGRVAGSPRLGLFLLGLIFLYLAVASLLPPPVARLLAGRGGLYGAWPLKLLLACLVGSVACATVFRVRFRLAGLGAIAAHVGVIVLAGGSWWYVGRTVSGYAVAHRDPASSLFLPVDRFYQSDGAALYLSALFPGGLEQVQRPLPALRQGQGLDGLIWTAPGVSVAVTDFLPAAVIEWIWRDDGPAGTSAVEVICRDGKDVRRCVLCPAYPFARVLDADGYIVSFPVEADPAGAAELADRSSKDVVQLVRTAEGQLDLTVFRPDGSRQAYRAGIGGEVNLPLAGREVALAVPRVLDRAWRAAATRPVRAGLGQPAIELEVAVGNWRGRQWVGFYHSRRPASRAYRDMPCLLLPEGKALFFQFAPRSRRLPRAFTIVQMRYKTYPGSGIPRDYLCTLAALDERGQPAEHLTCGLNRPADLGPVRLYQDEWRPGPEDPQEAIFLVRSRPGLWAVWLGCGLICVGIPYAFYVKPVLLRRRRRAS